MERSWLIRTTQNQILGPVTKQKILEFIQKGALGLTDEVTSGNGYWFHLREKDLVEKYLYGDIPQGYNPISESKSVLSRRENPDKTTSLNNSPVNQTVIFKNTLNPGVTPKSEDLDFPDITVVGKAMPKLDAQEVIKDAVKEDTKLPDDSDLEFPDVALITESVKNSPSVVHATETKSPVVENKVAPKSIAKSSDEEVHFPKDDDLEFPDFDSMNTSPKIEKGKVDLSHQYTRTVALDNTQMESVIPDTKLDENDLKFSVDAKDVGKKHRSVDEDSVVNAQKIDEIEEAAKAKIKIGKKNDKGPQLDDRKLLHERKPKSHDAQAMRKNTNEIITDGIDPHQGGSLKKRNDNYLFFILIILILIIIAVFFYFKEILNKPLPV